MQQFNFYSVFDSSVNEFGTPFIAKNDVIAMRIFEGAKKVENIYLEDLSLYRLGTMSIPQHFENSVVAFESCLLTELAHFENEQLIQTALATKE